VKSDETYWTLGTCLCGCMALHLSNWFRSEMLTLVRIWCRRGHAVAAAVQSHQGEPVATSKHVPVRASRLHPAMHMPPILFAQAEFWASALAGHTLAPVEQGAERENLMRERFQEEASPPFGPTACLSMHVATNRAVSHTSANRVF